MWAPPKSTRKSPLMHGARLPFQQPAVAGDMAAFAHQPHRRPERGRRRRDDRQAVALFQRLVDAERAQAAAGDTTPSASGAFATDLPLRSMMSLSLMRDGPPNSRMWKASSDEHLEAARDQQILAAAG